YLFHPDKEEDESLKEDSPLARLLQLKKAKRNGGRYGVLDRGRLLPETVRYEEMEVGRFEVTRAQDAQFDKAYLVEPGKENYPANGVPFERARAYCEWLSQETGQTYRLPSEKEAETLYDAPDGDDNTLDAWAGYAVNPEDALRLRDKLTELGGKAPLL